MFHIAVVQMQTLCLKDLNCTQQS